MGDTSCVYKTSGFREYVALLQSQGQRPCLNFVSVYLRKSRVGQPVYAFHYQKYLWTDICSLEFKCRSD